jgi:hypothetical protein
MAIVATELAAGALAEKTVNSRPVQRSSAGKSMALAACKTRPQDPPARRHAGSVKQPCIWAAFRFESAAPACRRGARVF